MRRTAAVTACLAVTLLPAGAAVPAAAMARGTLHTSVRTTAQAFTPATVQEVYRVPSSRVFTVDGRGYGHGYGMSQWGAAQAASQGVPADQILDFYYPGTTAAKAGNPWIRVALTGTGNGSTSVGYGGTGSYRYQCSDPAHASTYCALTVSATPGLVVTDSATGKHPDTTTGVHEWRVTVGTDGLHLAGYANGAWTAAPIGGRTAVTGPVLFSGPTFVKVDYGSSQRDYRGIVSADWTSAAGVTPARMVRIDALHLDDYVRGVVYREASSSWGPAALQAQAVAARSYAASFRRDSRAAHLPYDICDSTYCQVFGGSRLYSGGSSTWLEPDPAADPVAQTADTIRVTSSGAPLWAEFSSSNGGWTAGGATYSTPKYDTWDYHSADPSHRWTTTLSAAALERSYGFARLDELVVTGRDGTSAQWGGRVRSVRLVGVDAQGAARTVDLTSQSSVRFGMRSTYWHIHTVTISGPATAARGGSITLTGVGNPRSPVTIYLRQQGQSGYAALATVTTGDDGRYSRPLAVTRDVSYYAVSDGTTSPTRSTDVTGTTATGPARAGYGATVRVTGWAEPGATVTLWLRRAGATGYASGASTTAAATGAYALSYVADADYAWYASAAGYDSPVRQTTAVPTLTGPATVARATTVTLRGRVAPGAAVTVYRKAQNWTAYARMADLTADATGAFAVRYVGTVDDRYYAVSAGRTSATGLTRAVGTTVRGPATATSGTWVKVTGYALPGSTVTLHVHKAGSSSWVTRPTTTAGPAGWWTRSYWADASASYYADAAGQTSVTRTTTVTS